jgi:hypothetical protein
MTAPDPAGGTISNWSRSTGLAVSRIVVSATRV